MTPAIDLLKKQGIPHQIHQYQHDPRHQSYGLEAAESLGVTPDRVFKTLMFSINGDEKNLAVAIIPVSEKLNLKQAAKGVKAKKAEMGNPEIAQKISGYVVGGISPLGQKKRLPTLLDSSAQAQVSIYISAGKRGLEIEISPADLIALTAGTFIELT